MKWNFCGTGLAATAIALGGCSASEADADTSAMTAEEAQALDEAAEMLAERRLPEGTTDAPSVETGEEQPVR